MHALNLSPSPNELELQVLSPDGKILKVKLSAMPKIKQVDMVYVPVYSN